MAHIARGVQLARLLGFLAQPMVDRALLIVGANGTGKTTLVSDAVKALSATSFDSHVRVLHYQAGTSDEHFERRLVEFERDVVSKINDATATNASKQDAVARSLRELGQKETGSIVSAYEHLVNYENTSGKRVRTGLVVLPVLMGVLNSLSSAPPQMHLPRFKLVASLSETVHSPRNQRESDFIDQLLLQFTDLNTSNVHPTQSMALLTCAGCAHRDETAHPHRHRHEPSLLRTRACRGLFAAVRATVATQRGRCGQL